GMIQNRPDWCLSRQRVWGVPIPGFSCRGCGNVLITPEIVEHVAKLVEQHGTDVWFEREAAELLPTGTTCSKCGGHDFDKERDILDVWFESGVSHAAVLSRGARRPDRSGGRPISTWKAPTSTAAGSTARCWPAS